MIYNLLTPAFVPGWHTAHCVFHSFVQDALSDCRCGASSKLHKGRDGSIEADQAITVVSFFEATEGQYTRPSPKEENLAVLSVHPGGLHRLW